MVKGVLYDSTLCVGCRQCESACAERWKLPYDDKVASEERISAHKLTTVTTHGERFGRRMCMHCDDPTCQSVCPVGAFRKTGIGAVVYDAAKCMGCRYCMMACPFQVPAYEWNSRLPRVRKCDGCYDRKLAGQQTACSEACPTGATITGNRDELIADARRRLDDSPDGYFPRIYGLEEAGGTTTLILSAVPFEQIGLPNVPRERMPALTWSVLRFVPDIAVTGSVLMGGIWWITHRREAVAAAEGKEHRA